MEAKPQDWRWYWQVNSQRFTSPDTNVYLRLGLGGRHGTGRLGHKELTDSASWQDVSPGLSQDVEQQYRQDSPEPRMCHVS